MEIDVEAAAGTEMWICESKWWKDKKASVREVKSLLIKAGFMQKREGPGLKILKVWFFAYDGFTPEAESLMKENGFLWSDRADLDSLLIRVGLKKLPEV
jgi:hypothetical protein